MESPNPKCSKNSTAAAKETNPPFKSSKVSMEEDILKTAPEGLDKKEIGRGDAKTEKENSSMAEVIGGVVTDGQSIKKRKTNIEVKDIDPSKYPICPRCKREFPTYNAAIEHLRTCSFSGISNPSQSDLNKGADKVQPMEVEGSSNAVAAAAAPKPAECKGCGFDLNELPPSDEDDHVE